QRYRRKQPHFRDFTCQRGGTHTHTFTASRRAHTDLDLDIWPCSCVCSFLPPLIFSQLCKELPPRTVGYSWQLTYSTSRHGASLKSLYRKLRATDSPVLVVIKDALDEIFGAFLSHPLRLSETFYGTGETFLFMLHPRFKCFRWTGENSFFIKGDLDSFAIGGGSGHFGLWVDENLYLGRSSPCYTFNNCCLSETNDFRVMELEVWTFT
uniref:TLDc domain-containing protein n=1 Tax=Cyclopterus lumpus TaxID=8103 RepID=A0A8C2XM77_CYCLU